MEDLDTSSGTADQLKLIVLMENLLGQGKGYELTEDDVARVFVESGKGIMLFLYYLLHTCCSLGP
jgi:hypothetical protein